MMFKQFPILFLHIECAWHQRKHIHHLRNCNFVLSKQTDLYAHLHLYLLIMSPVENLLVQWQTQSMNLFILSGS